MPCKKHFTLGKLNFSISGDGEVYDYLVDEFSCLPSPEEKPKTLLDITFVESLPTPPKSAVANKNYIGWHQGYQYKSNTICYQLIFNNDKYTILVLESTYKKYTKIRKEVHQFFDWNYLTPAQNFAKNFMYECFNLTTGLILTANGLGCYIHASCMEKHRKGIALIASGGIGKTTSMLHLVTNAGWSYLSDDIGMLTDEGEIIRTPLRVQIYAYNLTENRELESTIFNKKTITDRLSWILRLKRKGPSKTRRRLFAEEIFGTKSVSKKSLCSTMIYMERSYIDGPKIEIMELKDLVEKLCKIMPKELGGINDLSDNLAVVGCSIPGFSDKEFTENQSLIFNNLKNPINIYRLSIPHDYSSKNLSEFIEAKLKSFEI